ncbi:hypothetical protein FYJ88_01345 [Corynebacterium urealyticum]|uniref:hypothetical protein n=1 Tax=Corynebacterium urealyticum TaxID=43771 RepID=UPI0011E67EAC|nr:hypothetical protein [Corynebacterium urealyticum]TYR17532.1 hypothetical protein FYJ88_01345 [Corynebacterium urealyticum]
MTCPHTLDAAKRLHDRYDRAQIARHRLMVPRQWNTLPTNRRREFIDIAEAVIHGDCTYQDQVVPRWVIDTIIGTPKETP